MMERESREKQIAAYASGCMDPEEKARFEELLKQDADLKKELESYRSLMENIGEWMKQEPPGLDRIEALTPPALDAFRQAERIMPPSPGTRIFWKRILAIAAVFLLGFLLGVVSPFILRQGHRDRQGDRKAESIIPAPGTQQVSETPAPVPGEMKGFAPEPGEVRRCVTRQNGRIIIETSRSGMNADSIWVVDASLRIADASPHK